MKLLDLHINEYKYEIKPIEESGLNQFSNVENGIKVSRKYLQKLRVVLRTNSFVNKENEIRFFKKQKPYIYGRLKYFAKLYKYLLQKPKGTIKSQRSFIDNEIFKLQEYQDKNIDFINYYRQNNTNLDEFYFLRGNDNLGLIADTSHFYTDAEFSTSHDNAVAKIIAYDLLISHYSNELKTISKFSGKGSQRDSALDNLNLSLVSNKIDIVELTYALIASGAIKGDLKELSTAFEIILGIDLGNFYRSFLEIRGRKENPTRFLDLLKSALLKKIEEADI